MRTASTKNAHAEIANLIMDLPNLYSTENIQEGKRRALVFRSSKSGWLWKAYEKEIIFDENTGDVENVLFFGRVEGFESEVGYFTLEDLRSVEAQFVPDLVEGAFYLNKEDFIA